MYLVRFNTKTYQFFSKEEAQGFAKTWSLQVEERINESVHRLAMAHGSHALDTVANLTSRSAIIELIKTYDLEWCETMAKM